MIWLLFVLVYILPIIGFYTIVYIKMESKQTISSYIDQNDLEDITIWIWIPLFNLVMSLGALIAWSINLIGKISKP